MREQMRMCFLPAIICVATGLANFNLKANMGTVYCATATVSEVSSKLDTILHFKVA